MEPPFVCNGWSIVFGPRFAARFSEMVERATGLRAKLSEEEYRRHPDVKLLTAVQRAITDIIPANPNAAEFRLRGDLGNFRRLKKRGLPERYRLFYTYSSTAKAIILLYLNDANTLRAEGSGNDPYVVFSGLVASGDVGPDFEANWGLWVRANPGLAPPEGTSAGPSPEALPGPGEMLTTVLTKVVGLRRDVVEQMTDAEAAAAWQEYLDSLNRQPGN